MPPRGYNGPRLLRPAVSESSTTTVSGEIIAVLVMLSGGGVVYLLDRDRCGSENTGIKFLRAASG